MPGISLDNSLKLIKAALGDRDGATDAEIRKAEKKLGRSIPGVWKKVMRTANGGLLLSHAAKGKEFDMSPAADFSRNNDFARQFIQMGWPDLPEAYVAVVANEYQDFYFLDTSRIDGNGDCPVLFIEHELAELKKEWPSIEALLEYILGHASGKE